MSWSEGNSVPCVFCLEEHAARLRLDKKGRPYVICVACGTRSFLHSPVALRIYGYLAHDLIAKLRGGMIDAQAAAAASAQMQQALDQQLASRGSKGAAA